MADKAQQKGAMQQPLAFGDVVRREKNKGLRDAEDRHLGCPGHAYPRSRTGPTPMVARAQAAQRARIFRISNARDTSQRCIAQRERSPRGCPVVAAPSPSPSPRSRSRSRSRYDPGQSGVHSNEADIVKPQARELPS
ncbi:GL15808 [Drosophila persimilis]|uniref:GL15808 n=1 Tax=Drosophila persimilis TaxID=7234 RepID=B4H0Q6_DROPE|nr:GL15808 [Drosophila persimilis]